MKKIVIRYALMHESMLNKCHGSNDWVIVHTSDKLRSKLESRINELSAYYKSPIRVVIRLDGSQESHKFVDWLVDSMPLLGALPEKYTIEMCNNPRGKTDKGTKILKQKLDILSKLPDSVIDWGLGILGEAAKME